MSKPIVVKTIESIERENSSVNGNPAFTLTFTDGSVHRTASDASVSYEIGNPGRRAGSTVGVTLSAGGRIEYLSDLPSQTGYDSERLAFQHAATQIDAHTTSADLEGPGRYDGCTDRVLAWALDTLHGAGCAEEEGGSVEFGRHMARFGRFVLETDEQGFVDVFIHFNEADAVASIARQEAAQNGEVIA